MILAALLTVLGIGLVLFVHEAGHFLAARLAGVRVEVFSLGFGPRLAGWRRHGTDYRISLLPLGGYVRLGGEDQMSPARPDDLSAKSPGWRFLIFAGGIFMNFLFALVMIPLLFRLGVPFEAPVAGYVQPGGPAWQAGLRSGDRVLAVAGDSVYAFRNVAAAVALSDAETVTVEVERDGVRLPLPITPSYDAARGIQVIGVDAAMDPGLGIVVPEDSQAYRAGLRSGDRVTAILGLPVSSPLEFQILYRHALFGESVTITVERAGRSLTAELRAVVPEGRDLPYQVGLRQVGNRVKQARGALRGHLQDGDVLLSAAGEPLHNFFQLAALTHAQGGLPPLRVRRAGQELELPARPGVTLAGLAADLWMGEGEEVEIVVHPGGPAERAGLRSGDVVLRADHEVVDSFATLQRLVRAAGRRPVSCVVRRAGAADLLSCEIVPATLAQPDFGFVPLGHQEIVRSSSLGAALRMGLSEAAGMVREIVATLSGMLSGRVAKENLGGIIAITQITYSFANAGLVPLLFFLAMISIHLGVLNLLPIPALDGGHLLFVVLEKLRGRPVSQRTQTWFNLVGVMAVLSLIIFVTIQDIQRLAN